MKLRFRELLTEFLSSNFNFDTRLGRTLLDLLLSPGEITKQFNAGKRVRYVRPLQLYLFVSFLYFLLLGFTSNNLINTVSSESEEAPVVDANSLGFDIDGGGASAITMLFANTDPYNEAEIDSLLAQLDTPDPEPWERHVAKQAVRAMNPIYKDQFKKEVFANLSWAMFLLLPLFAFYLWVMVRKQDPFFIDSVIFSVHFHTVVFILFGIRLLSELAFSSEMIGILTSLLALLFMVLSVKKVYGLRWRSAILRSLLLTVSYSFTFGLAYICIVLFSFWIF